MHKNDWEKYFRSNLLLCSMYYAESCNEFARPISASLRMGNKTSFKKTSQRWLAVGNTVSNSTSPTFNIRGGQHRGPFLYRYRYRPCFFKNVSVLVPSILFSHFFDRYSLLGTSFVICPEWSFNLFKLRTDQVKNDDSCRPTPLAAECCSYGYGRHYGSLRCDEKYNYMWQNKKILCNLIRDSQS